MDKSIVPVNQLTVRSSTCYEFSNPNGAEVVEIEDDPVEVVEKQMEHLKLNHQFSEKDVPQIFQDLLKEKKNNLKKIELNVYDENCTMTFDDIEIDLEGKGKGWLISYDNKTVKTVDPEKSIIDHLWFVLKNPDIKLKEFRIQSYVNPESDMIGRNLPKIDLEKLNTLVLSMIDSIDHQFHIESFGCEAFNINVFLSLLKHLKPATMEGMHFGTAKKDEGNCQIMREIIKTEQWKQAKRICSSHFVPSLKIEDLLHCNTFTFSFEKITPEDVLRFKELLINSTIINSCMLFYDNEDLDIDAFRKALLPNSLSEKKVNILFMNYIVFTYELPNSPNCLSVMFDGFSINFNKIPIEDF